MKYSEYLDANLQAKRISDSCKKTNPKVTRAPVAVTNTSTYDDYHHLKYSDYMLG